MKNQFKLLTLAASAAMMFTACSSDKLETYAGQPDLNPEAPSNAIQFGTYMGRTDVTRAGATGTIVDRTKEGNKLGDANYEFGVFGYYHSTAWSSAKSTATPNFMYNQKVDYNTTVSGKWGYTPLKYWPNGIDAANSSDPYKTAQEQSVQYLSFFAYAPYVTTFTGTGSKTWTFTPSTGKFMNGSDDYASDATATGILEMTGNATANEPKVHYRIGQGTNFVDLLWGMRPSGTYDEADNGDNTIAADAYNTDLTKQSTEETVDFKFKHAVAKIGAGATGLRIIADIDKNTDSESGDHGTLSGTTAITVQQIVIKNVANKAVTEGWFNLATGEWKKADGTALELGTIAEGEAFTITWGADDLNADIYEAASTNIYTPGTSAWAVAGVTPTAKNVLKTATNGIFLMPDIAGQQLKISITYEIRTYDENLSGNYSTISQTITNEVTLPTLAVNKNYNLLMHVGLTSVKFSATVEDWGDATDSGDKKEIWLPSNVVVPTP